MAKKDSKKQKLKKEKLEAKKKAEKAREEKRKKIVKAYVEVVKGKRMFPTREDMAEQGYTRDMIRHHFINMARLRDMAKMLYPKAFEGVVEVEDYLGEKAQKDLEKKINKHKRFFITTAVNGQFIHKGFMKSIENYCEVNKAQLLVLPSHDPAHNLDNQIEWHFASQIIDKDYPIIFEQLDLNSNLHISGIRINAKQINPTTGLSRISQGKGSFIFASPKQSLEFVPTSNVKLPHAMMSTGSCTLPNYKTSLGNSLRTAFLAHYDHVIGGIIVEVVDDKIYHFRQVQADAKGNFIDLGKMYTSKTVKDVKGAKLIMGDYHAGEHDEPTVEACEKIIDDLKIDTVFLHDMFNGASINHHEDHNIIKKAQRAKMMELYLSEELHTTSVELDRIGAHKSVKEIVMVKSNHDEFLLRWLQDGRFKNDPHNFQIGCKLADAAVDGEDPLKAGIEAIRKPKHHKKIKWLHRDEDYKVAGIELGNHGDKGPNGSRGSIKNLEKAYGKAVIGHSHTPGILRGIWQVGTSSLLDLGYNVGPSSWVHCSCILYPNGQRQLINFIDGKYKL